LEQRAAAKLIARHVQSGRAICEALLPGGTQLDFEEAQAAEADFVLMGNPSGAKHDREGAVLSLTAAVTFAVQAIEEQSEKRELVGMHKQFAGNGMTQVRKNGPALFVLAVNGAIEATGAHAKVADVRTIRCAHRNSPSQKRLSLF